MTTYGIVLFDGAEELDFAGPWEVFAVSEMVRNNGVLPDGQVVTVAEHEGLARCNKGMRVAADHTFATCPPREVILVPGGQGTRQQATNKPMLQWLSEQSAVATWMTSVCTGSLLLVKAGVAAGRRVATHWSFEDALTEMGEATVVRDARWVRDGNVVTSQGVSAGIDMALWLVGQLHGRKHALAVQRYIQYDPAPPYQAEV